MDKIGYLIGVSIKQATRSLKLTIMIFLCFYLGMILPFYCFASYNSLEKNLEMLNFESMDKSISATWTSLHIDKNKKSELEKFIDSNKISYKISSQFIIKELNNTSVLVYGIDKVATSHEIILRAGRIFNYDKNECIIGAELADKYNYNLNDYITFKHEKYKIVGITNSRSYISNMIIPIDLFEDDIKNEDVFVQYDIVALFNDSKELKKHENDILLWINKEDIGMDNINIRQSIEDYNQSKDTIKKWVEARIVIGVGGLVFAIVNMMMVLIGKIHENKKIYGIKLALGMSRSCLYFSFLIENIIIALFSNLGLFATMPIISKLLNMDNVMDIDAFVIVGIMIITTVVCMIISGILMLKVSKKSIVDMTREEL